MNTVRLRHAAQINPPAPAFDLLDPEDDLTFLPMEAVWPGAWRELSSTRTKAAVATGFTRFQNGDVLVPKITPTFEAGRAVLVDGLRNSVGAGTTELHVLRAGSAMDPRFLLYVVNTHQFLKMGEAEMYGVAGQQRVPDSFLRNLEVALLPLEEQRRIADFLDAETSRIDTLIRLQRQVLEKLDNRIGVQRDIEISRLAKLGKLVPLRRFVWSVDQGSSPQCDAIPAGDGEWGVLKVSCLRPGVFIPAENKRLPDGIRPNRASEVRRGDLLITRANTPQLVGATAVVGEVRPMLLLPDKIFRVRLSEKVLPEFIAEVAAGTNIRALCAATSNGASQSMANIRFEEVKAWPIPLVPLPDQRTFVAAMQDARSNIASLADSIRRQLKLLAERRQALITAAVTGQFDVSTASGRNTIQGV